MFTDELLARGRHLQLWSQHLAHHQRRHVPRVSPDNFIKIITEELMMGGGVDLWLDGRADL